MKHTASRFVPIILLLFIGITFESCQSYSDGRMLKKFVSRFNSEEYGCASRYIYPEDKIALMFFETQVKDIAPNTFIKIKDYEVVGEGDNRSIKAELKWVNATPALHKYFEDLGYPLSEDGLQTVDIQIRQTVDGGTLTFPYGVPGAVTSELFVTSVHKDDSGKVPSIYKSPSKSSKKVGEMTASMVVGEANKGWRPIYSIGSDGSTSISYVKESSLYTVDRSPYFSISIFDSMGLLLAFVLIVVIAVPLIAVRNIFAVFSNGGCGGIAACIVLILGLIYCFYQLLEKVLFEVFIWNLPY